MERYLNFDGAMNFDGFALILIVMFLGKANPAYQLFDLGVYSLKNSNRAKEIE
jgi:hypothetical protein